MTSILEGRSLSARINAQTIDTVQELATHDLKPRLNIVHATEDAGAEWYIRAVSRAASKVGVEVVVDTYPDSVDLAFLRVVVEQLVDAAKSDGIVFSAPLPSGVNASRLGEALSVNLDSDGVSPISLGRLMCGLPCFVATTAAAVVELLKFHNIALAGRTVAVIGRSTVVGKPLAQLLLNENATVIACHSRTSNLAELTAQADIVVSAAGIPGLVTLDHVKTGAVIIDVGTTPDESGKLLGDVTSDVVDGSKAWGVSPVPGGVGPITTALLLANVVTSCHTRLVT